MFRSVAFALFASVSCVAPASAFDLAGTKSVVAHTRDGQAIEIGTIRFTPNGDKIGYELDMDFSRFKDFFLSMREFKCLEGAEVQCYVPYPYANPKTVTKTDLTWLEHSLLFFYKAPPDYGAKLSNGIFYALKLTDKGITGTPESIDLNAIAAPPSDPSIAPYPASERTPIQEGARWIASLSIEDKAQGKADKAPTQ